MNFYLILTLSCLAIQAFFAMNEMAIVSINRVRLQYYLSRGSKKGKWIYKLLTDPSRLFGTTLIGINAAMQFGSEAARRFYLSYGLDPDLAVLSQILFVLIFSELAPLFAARRYAESVAMIGIYPLYLFSILLRPLTYCLGVITSLIDRLFRGDKGHDSFLTKDELQRAIEAREDRNLSHEKEEFNYLIKRIFQLKSRIARDQMIHLEEVDMIPTGTKISEVRRLFREKGLEHLPIYFHSRQNIIGVVSIRHLIKASNDARVDLYMKTPWLIAEGEPLSRIIEQFRKNGQSIAIVLNLVGHAVGIITLDAILSDLFEHGKIKLAHLPILIDRAFDPFEEIEKINERFGIDLPTNQGETLEELVTSILGHHPHQNEYVRINDFELHLEMGDLLKSRKILVKSIR